MSARESSRSRPNTGREIVYDSMQNTGSETFLALLADTIEEPFDVSHINEPFRSEVLRLIECYKPQKSQSTEVKLAINLTDKIPIFQRSRRLPFAEQAIVEKQISEWLKDGIIKASCSDYAAPIVLCKKKDGSARLCIDFRKLNKKIRSVSRYRLSKKC